MLDESIYTHDDQGRLMLKGEPHNRAMRIARSKQVDRERWQPYHWEYHGTAGDFAAPKPPEPNERPAAKELNALWEENTRIREELRKIREELRGLTQALVNTRKEASLSRGGGGRTQPREKPLSGL